MEATHENIKALHEVLAKKRAKARAKLDHSTIAAAVFKENQEWKRMETSFHKSLRSEARDKINALIRRNKNLPFHSDPDFVRKVSVYRRRHPGRIPMCYFEEGSRCDAWEIRSDFRFQLKMEEFKEEKTYEKVCRIMEEVCTIVYDGGEYRRKLRAEIDRLGIVSDSEEAWKERARRYFTVDMQLNKEILGDDATIFVWKP